jgi:hypothetical protein
VTTTSDYAATIDLLAASLADAAQARLDLDDAERQLALFEAGVVAAGLEGSNEQQRKANLTIALACDAEYRLLRDGATEARCRVADADIEVTITRERCRLLRLTLAQAVSDGVLEGAFA